VTVLDLETYRRQAEAFVGALETEHYLHFSGRKAVCDTSAVYDRFPELFTRPVINELERLYELAARAGVPILEDDYDHEFRYAGSALPAIFGLDAERRTFHIGTFSKIMLPSFRLGYIVVPTDFMPPSVITPPGSTALTLMPCISSPKKTGPCGRPP